MRVVRDLVYRVQAGSLECTVEYNEQGEPQGIYPESRDDREALESHAPPLELVERLALLCQAVRARNGDRRRCCADHGYYEPVEHDEGEPECPGCLVEVRAKDGAARARAVGDVT